MRKSRPSGCTSWPQPKPPARLRVGPGRGRRAEHRALRLLHRLAGEEIVERIRHLQDDVLDPPDALRQPPRLVGPGLEVPAIGNDDLAARFASRARPGRARPRPSSSAASRRGRGSPSPAPPMRARSEARAARRRRRRPSARRRASRDSLRSRARCRTSRCTSASSAAPSRLTATISQSGLLLQHRDVVGDRPPAGADDADPRLGHAVLPMASSVERCTFRMCTTIACSAASASRAENAATIASWSASDWLEHARRSPTRCAGIPCRARRASARRGRGTGCRSPP